MIVFGVLAVFWLACVLATCRLMVSDLIARGTSLLSMFPNAMTTTVANVRRKMVHAKAGLIIGNVRTKWCLQSRSDYRTPAGLIIGIMAHR